MYAITTIPGDGIGTEVIDAVMPLLDATAAKYDFSYDATRVDWGSKRYLSEGAMMPDNGIDQLADSDAILLGAVGHPDVPDHTTLHGLLLPIRKEFDQFICKRPSVLFDGIESPLAGYDGGDIDLVVYRENTEGEYSDSGGREHRGFEHEVAIQTSIFTRTGTERIVRAAFEEALTREGKLTSITKSNAQAHSMVFWDEIVSEIAEEYPDVEVESLLVDAASMDLVRRPEEFDVIVASNLFGDIATDIAAIVTGSMGLAPSANITERDEYPSMFEPVHGSAPDIMGEGVANPLATVLSVSMMLDELGEKAASEELWDIVAAQLREDSSPRTPDLGGDGTTEQVIDDLIERL